MKNKPTILLTTYDFPPIGGGGIQRNLKFLKYLDEFGWSTNVLTVKEREYYVYDYTLLKEIPHTKIHRADSLDPASLLTKFKNLKNQVKNSKNNNASLNKDQKSGINESAWYVDLYRVLRDWTMIPDGYGAWMPFAYAKGKEVIKKTKPDVLFATFPFPTNAFITYYLSKKFKIPYVIDFRDPWLDDMYVSFPSFFHKKFHAHYEKKITEHAASVIVYGEPLKISLEKKYPKLKGKVHVINNGYDPADFSDLVPIEKNFNKKRIVYSGAVYVDRRDTYKVFLESISKLSAEERSKLEVIFVGDNLNWALELVDEFKLNDVISFTGYLNHSEALNYLASADCALMFLKKGDRYALTGKIFEYIGLGLPVMACVEPDGECAKLLRELDHNQGVATTDESEIMKDVLQKVINGEMPKLPLERSKIFSRKYHTEVLNEILRKIVNK